VSLDAASGTFLVKTREGDLRGDGTVSLYFRLDEALNLQAVSTGDDYDLAFHRLVRQGVIPPEPLPNFLAHLQLQSPAD
jgi:hypothetical protein